METNAKLFAIALLTATLTSPFAIAQSQPNPNEPAPAAVGVNSGPDRSGPDRPGMDRFGRDRPGHGRRGSDGMQPGGPGKHRSGRYQSGRSDNQRFGRGGLTSLTTVSGTVGQWVSNDDAVLDGFTFTGSTNQATTIKFPPHLGQQVQKAIKPGSSVSVTGYSEKTREGEQFRMTSLTAGKTTVVDAPPTAPATPPTPTLTTVTGKIADYKFGRDGRVNALVLDDKTIVRIPSHVAYQLTNLATKGSAITVQGYPRNLREGQVQLEKTNILRASVLTINGQQYLVR